MYTVIRRAAVLVALIATAGCTVKNAATPTEGGPSTFATSFTVNAIPDTISQDGGSQSSVKILVIGPTGKSLSAVPMRVDMSVNGVAQDYGTLSARTIVTNADGIATVVYTAPPGPPNGLFGTCANLPGTCVEIVATPTGTNFQTVVSQAVTIRLVPPGVILPPAGSPTAVFTSSPSPAFMNVPVTFDAARSIPGVGASEIASYTWNFGDGGAQGTGRSISHTFTAPQTFNVTLTVVNDRGLAASTVVGVTVGAVTAPSPTFVFSPSAPAVGQLILFNAEQSTAAPGHTLSGFNWNFGDGATASGVTVSHVFTTAATFNVVLSVTDDTGQKGTTSSAVTVSPGGGGGGITTARFTFSPATPNAGQAVFFNASTSSASPGHTLTAYGWDFGDGTSTTGVSISHVFLASGTFTVTLTVTDDTPVTPLKGTIATPVVIAPAGSGSLTAEFNSSPGDPRSGQLVTFNANLSSPIASITSYDWDFGDGTVVNGVTSFLIDHTYFTPTGNSFVVRLTVHDNTGRVATITHGVTISAGLDPVASFTISQSPVPTNTDVTFNGSLSTAAGGKTIVRYLWEFGDTSLPVSTSSPASPPHRYSPAGTYTIRLTVTDSAGLTGSTTRTLLVQ
jgi:PKD repeat protein